MEPTLVLQAVRPIAAGKELLLWFSEDILAMLQMVFLTPANIQGTYLTNKLVQLPNYGVLGQKKYVCTKSRCATLYESPNPLKLHIALGCGRQNISELWSRLTERLKSYSDPPKFSFQLTNIHTSPSPQKRAMDLSPPVKSGELYKPYSDSPSAFKPFSKQIQDNHPKPEGSPLFPIQNQFYAVQAVPTFDMYINGNVQYNDEAQIESFVSNLGKSKEGHVCLYCGKCYSRKYGLKIHIRTHTGYKPLKCKFCLRPFGDPSNLNKHIRLHAEGETPYK